MRTLYIVAGVHPYPGQSLDELQTQSVYLQTELIFRIALVEGCTGLCSDRVGAESAVEYNWLLEKLTVDDEERSKLLRIIRKYEQELDPTGNEEILINKLVSLRKFGVPIVHLPTEEHFDYVRFLQGKIPNGEWEQLHAQQQQIKTEAEEDEFHVRLYEEQNRAEILMTERDHRIYNNVLHHGHQHNILHVGKEHKLLDFQEREHDFTVYRADVLEEYVPEKIVVTGKLPQRLEETIVDLHDFPLVRPFDNRIDYEENMEQIVQ